MNTKRIPALACAAAVLLAGGCGDSSGPSDVVITERQAEDAGSMIASQVADLVNDFTVPDFDASPLAKAASLIPPSSRFDSDMLRRAWPRFLASDSCASFSDTTDTDSDGVPDDLIVRFDQPGCIEVGDSVTATLSGSFRITDPGANPGFDIAYSSILLRLDHVNGDYLSFGLNGTQGVGATTTTASANSNMSYTAGARVGTQTANVSLSQNWNAGYAAASGQVLRVNEPLPDGALTVTGSSTWRSNRDNFSFALSTPQPLQHLASCQQEPAIESGTVHALVSGNSGGAYVRVQFIGCGEEPIVTLVGRPAQ